MPRLGFASVRAERFMQSSAAVTRPNTGTDAMGGRSATNTAVGTYPCSYVPVRIPPDLSLLASGDVEARSRWSLAFPVGTDVRVGDQVTVDGHVFNVESPRDPRTRNWQVEVYATRVN